MNAAQLISFRSHVAQGPNATMLGYATIICPESSWEEAKLAKGADPHRPHELCRKLLNGSLLMDVAVKYHHQRQAVDIDVPATPIDPPCGRQHKHTHWFQNLVKLQPDTRQEIVRLICLEAL